MPWIKINKYFVNIFKLQNTKQILKHSPLHSKIGSFWVSSLPIITSWLPSGTFPPRSCLLIALLAQAPFKLLWKPLYPTRMMSKPLSLEQHLFKTSMKMPPPPRLGLTVEAAVLALVWAGGKNLSSSLAEGRGSWEGDGKRAPGKGEWGRQKG